ncbi:MAG: hypothetical protein H0X39_10900 [Actinobacteria bacterium]|nr:hypothetical protein [Actinomycetota bacterium]
MNTNDRRSHMLDKSLYAASFTCIALSLALVAVAGAAASGQRSERTTLFTQCPPLTSMHWNINGKSGNRYIVETQSFSCARALKLIPALIKQQGGYGDKILRGPAGYKCLSGERYDNPHALAGNCREGGYSGPFFGWTPKIS